MQCSADVNRKCDPDEQLGTANVRHTLSKGLKGTRASGVASVFGPAGKGKHRHTGTGLLVLHMMCTVQMARKQLIRQTDRWCK